MRVIKLFLMLAIFLGLLMYGIKFATKNIQTVNLVFPLGRETGEIELWLLVFLSAGVGAALALLVLVVEMISLQAGKQRLSRRVKQLERELTSMRNLPLSESAAVDRPKGAEPGSPAQSAAGDVPSI